jgi:predicted DNA binding protein
MPSDIVQCRFDIEVPQTKWLYKLNKSYSHLDFNILSNYLINENIGNTLFEIKGFPLDKFIKEFKSIVPISSFLILHNGEDFLLLNVRIRDPWIINALVKTKLLLIYPLKVKNGKIIISVISEREKVNNFLENLEKSNINFHIIQIGQYQHRKVLTYRQTKLLKILYQNGYYEIPRKTSLTSLAKKLKISPSALSESIRRLHKNLARLQLYEED